MKLLLQITTTNVNLVTFRGTALHLSCFSNNFSAVKLLLNNMANPEFIFLICLFIFLIRLKNSKDQKPIELTNDLTIINLLKSNLENS